MKSVKNLLSIPKVLLEDGFNWDTIKKLAIEKIVLPAITIFTYEGDKITGFKVGSGGQMEFDFTNRQTSSALYSIYDSGNKLVDKFKNLFSDSDIISIDVTAILEKIESIQTIDISVPDINVPEIKLLQSNSQYAVA